uniref:Uncharacterized protein n=1 Tax=Arundo donax TaxID=35708 RepID=A0A0A8XXH4_ARUDO
MATSTADPSKTISFPNYSFFIQSMCLYITGLLYT